MRKAKCTIFRQKSWYHQFWKEKSIRRYNLSLVSLRSSVDYNYRIWTFRNLKNTVLTRIKQTDTYRIWERKLRDDSAKAAIAARLFRLANGLIGDVSSVGEGVHELRVHYGPGYRIYFKQCSTELVILLCGGNKRTQQRDIGKAKLLAAEWKNDNGNEAI